VRFVIVNATDSLVSEVYGEFHDFLAHRKILILISANGFKINVIDCNFGARLSRYQA